MIELDKNLDKRVNGKEICYYGNDMCITVECHDDYLEDFAKNPYYTVYNNNDPKQATKATTYYFSTGNMRSGDIMTEKQRNKLNNILIHSHVYKKYEVYYVWKRMITALDKITELPLMADDNNDIQDASLDATIEIVYLQECISSNINLKLIYSSEDNESRIYFSPMLPYFIYSKWNTSDINRINRNLIYRMSIEDENKSLYDIDNNKYGDITDINNREYMDKFPYQIIYKSILYTNYIGNLSLIDYMKKERKEYERESIANKHKV